MFLWSKVPWQKYIAWVRVLLAAVALTISSIYTPDLRLIRGLMLLFLAYSVIPAARARGMRGLIGLLALLGDTIYFLVLAVLPTEHLLWTASLFHLYLLTEAVVYYSSLEVCVVAGACVLFCIALVNG